MQQDQPAAAKNEFAAELANGASQPLAWPSPPDENLASDASVYPMSFSQQRLWFLDQLEPGKSVYNVSEAFRFRGALNVLALEESIQAVVQRHESLRTTFATIDDEPMQIVAPSLKVPLRVHDLRELPPQHRESSAKARASDEANRPFDLKNGPLIRTLLLRLADDEYILLLGMHHIISEGGWSMGIFLRELNQFYNALAANHTPQLAELPIQFGDYAVWQREYMQGALQEELLGFWKKQLEGAPAVLDMPSDHVRPSHQSYDGARESYRLSSSLKEQLKALSRSEGATLFMSLFAGFNTLLSRYTSRDDLVTGVSVSGRGSAETHDLIGFFANTLAVRSDLSGDPSFRELLRRTKQTCLGAYEHDDLPFELLVDALKPERSLAYSPLFQAMFAFQNAPREELHLTAIEVSPFALDLRTSMFDLTLFAWERPEGVLLDMEYSTDLFERATIQNLFRHFEILLAGAVANPEAPISQLPLLDQSERQRILLEWNSSDAEYRSERCIHQLFEEQVHKTPQAVAVKLEDASLSYAELNRRANQLAHHLKKLGVGPDRLVAVCVERSLEMIVAVLGVLKAGGAYVPLDPAYPGERLRYMLKDCAPAALLTQGHLKALFAGLSEAFPVLDLDDPAPGWKHQPETDLDAARMGLKSSHLAYVIYTSGSTGVPKGVMVEHLNVARLFTATDAWFHFGPKDVWTLFHSYAFDFSVWEIWGALLYGGRLVVVSRDMARSTEEFYKLICREKVTILNQTPSAFRQLIAAQAESLEMHRLRQVIFGGEALEVATLKPWYEQNPNQPTELINMYGITETTVHVTYRPLERADTEMRGGSPIGCRIPDLRIYILDAQRQPVPVGVVGELYVGGAGVARGYLNRPELTAERFLPDPFVADGKARMYKTGDLGKWLPGGAIEFLGRNDFQVKIRGFRIELGEIEARLAEQAGVRDAAVIAREDTPGDLRLVAYYTDDRNGAAQGAEVLRANLSAKLPDYMVPAAYVRLESLPLTSNGKLDRKALPAPATDSYAVRGYEAPTGEIQTTLVAIWEKLLNRRPIGVRDNFFDLGGHSLLLTRLISQIQKQLGQRLPIATVFESPTIEALASVLSGRKTTSSACRVIPLKPEGTRPPFICLGASPLFLPLARLLGPDQPFYGLDLTELQKIKLPNPSKLEDIGAYVVEAVRDFQPKGPYYIGGWCMFGVLALEAARQLLAQGHEVALLTIIDTPNVAYRKGLSKAARLQMKTQKWLYHLANLSKSSPAELIQYSMGLIRNAGNKVVRLRERLSFEMGLQEVDIRLMDLDPILFYAVTTYRPQLYPGRVLMVQAFERPAGQHWQIATQWRQSICGETIVHHVCGGHEGMFKYPHVETLAAKMKASFEQASKAGKIDHDGDSQSGLPTRPLASNGSLVPPEKRKEPTPR